MKNVKKKYSFTALVLGAALLLCGGAFANRANIALADEEASAACVHQPSAEGDCSLCGEKIVAYSQADEGEKTYYIDLSAAFSSYNDGDRVTLVSDISVDEWSVIELSKSVTIDLNGHYITSGQVNQNYFKVVIGVSFALENGLESNPIGIINDGFINGGAYYGSVSGDGNITGGTFNASVKCETITGGMFNASVNCGWQLTGGTFNGEVTSSAAVSGGKFNGKLINNGDIDITNITFGGNATVKNNVGGTINGDSEADVVNCDIENYGKIESGNFGEGCTVTNYGTIKNGNFGGKVIVKKQKSILGGTYAHIECDGFDNLVAALYIQNDDEVSYAFADAGDGVTLKDAYNNQTLKNVKVCEHTAHSIGVEGSCACGLECDHVFVGGFCTHCSMPAGARTYENTYYANLAKAVEKWETNEYPITLLKDNEIKNHLTINKSGIKINLNGFSVTSYEGVIVYVDNGASIYGEGEFAANIKIVGDGVSVSLKKPNDLSKVAGVTAKYSNITVTGKNVSLNGLTIENLQVNGSADLTNCAVKKLVVKNGATVKLSGGSVQLFDLESGISFKDILVKGYAYKSAVGKVRLEDMSAEISVDIVKCDTHKWVNGECAYCQTVCTHESWKDGVCENCNWVCTHTGGTATCEDKPVCELCHQSYGSALGHDIEDKWTIDTPATCLSAGSRSHHCSRCDAKKYVDEIPALGHTGGTATCSQQAVCERCNTKYGEYAAHDFGEWIAQQNATCESDGVKGHYECGACGAYYDLNNNKITDLTISKLGHDYEGKYTIDTPATCTTVGYKSRHCTRCSATISKTPITLGGHKGGTANCQHGAICTVCGEEYGEKDKENHVGVLIWEQKVYTHREYWSCCDSDIVDSGEHDWVNGACSVCLYKCVHTGGTATCTEKAICDRCGWAYGQPLGHDFQNLTTIDKVATCTESGECSHHCERCEAREGVEEIKPRGHVGGVANCAHGAICTECHEEYGEVDHSKHMHLTSIAELAPTYDSDGNIAYYYCDGCEKCYSDAQASVQITKEQTVLKKLVTQVVQGNNAGWIWGDEKDVGFKLNGLPQGLVTVFVDGEELDEHDYEFVEESNQILLKAKYLNTLSNGAHLFGVSAGEQFVNTAFSISGAPESLSAGAWVGIALAIVAGLSMCAFIAFLFMDSIFNKPPEQIEQADDEKTV